MDQCACQTRHALCKVKHWQSEVLGNSSTTKGENKLEMVVVNMDMYGPTLSGNLSGESMNMFKDLIQGKMPMI